MSRGLSGESHKIFNSSGRDVVLINRVINATAGVFRPLMFQISAFLLAIFVIGFYNNFAVRL